MFFAVNCLVHWTTINSGFNFYFKLPSCCSSRVSCSTYRTEIFSQHPTQAVHTVHSSAELHTILNRRNDEEPEWIISLDNRGKLAINWRTSIETKQCNDVSNHTFVNKYACSSVINNETRVELSDKAGFCHNVHHKRTVCLAVFYLLFYWIQNMTMK